MYISKLIRFIYRMVTFRWHKLKYASLHSVRRNLLAKRPLTILRWLIKAGIWQPYLGEEGVALSASSLLCQRSSPRFLARQSCQRGERGGETWLTQCESHLCFGQLAYTHCSLLRKNENSACVQALLTWLVFRHSYNQIYTPRYFSKAIAWQ